MNTQQEQPKQAQETPAEQRQRRLWGAVRQGLLLIASAIEREYPGKHQSKQ